MALSATRQVRIANTAASKATRPAICLKAWLADTGAL
ncbi:hypothetical protein SAMN05216255_4096 [Pseudomonas segetis]|uniref:Uncharacterized protein n=1 Tax=Pseudomonas segetis TaxID=298908 RepID=A0A239IYQ4_9PSED|nr:hypothetical protein SAMN05216255_4096 [Pseudomonas segetis]